MTPLQAHECLPLDVDNAILVGRVWRNGSPSVVALRRGDLFDISATVATVADLT